MSQRRTIRRILLSILALIIVVAMTGGAALLVALNRPLPNHSGEHLIPEADGLIEVMRDANGIPHIYGTTDEDLFRAQGYVHAQDRFFEMDYRRHMTGGRLSELVGDAEAARQADVVIRSMGWRRLAEQEWDLISDESRDFYTAYAEGVNAYIADRGPSELALEYQVLSLSMPVKDIEPWTGIDSLAWLKAMAWDLKNNLDEETARVVAYDSLRDSARVEELFPAFSTTSHTPIVPSEVESNLTPREDYPRGESRPIPTAPSPAPEDAEDSVDAEAEASAEIGSAVLSAQAALDAMPIVLGRGSGIGSNSFVIGGEHTESGMPILANDPHLTISYPSVWYQVALHCVEITDDCTYDASGFSFAGMPGLIIGRNADLAWGLTNLGGDVTDFVIERNTGETTYERDGEDVEYEIWTETFNVAGADSFEAEVRQSVHGPVISDLLLMDERTAGLPGVPGEFSVALEWTALKPGLTGDAIFAINRAANAEDVAEAAAIFAVPAQNIVFATVDGEYGYQAPGHFPIRPEISEADGDLEAAQIPENLGADGRWPRPGWDSAYDWQGYYAPEDMPAFTNPDEGFIVAANQQVTASDLGPFLGSYSDGGYRSEAIRQAIQERIDSGSKMSLADAERLMLLDQSPFGQELGELFATVPTDDERIRQAQDIVSDWLDRGAHTGVDEPGAAIMASVYAHLLDQTLGERISQFDAVNTTDYLIFFTGLEESSPWWDNGVSEPKESRDEALLNALHAMDRDLSAQMGEDMESWRWGDVHVETPTHSVLGGEDIPGIVRSHFNGDPLSVPGGSAIPNAMHFSPAVGEGDGLVDYEVTAGPSMRMAVDMAGLDEAIWIISSGSSGHPRSGRVDDQFEMWASGQSLPWVFTRERVEERSQSMMTIRSEPSTEDRPRTFRHR
ncbi:penicillin acylase family protein [Flaviflexus salsibiostraticola]|uniref:Penicillin acylase family protein n=1 Tax=Flaviflexus salsibiostraticola TaxID=1282737 RepID=A0A3S8Z725_9ACTO|nr:penicillin acylase family protein [Flaviflexus salsibiostraticola]AZN29312.1 penicillin acylase family protein [Flaviflexus salsibiostraticola]